jgi:hypothetical protein
MKSILTISLIFLFSCSTEPEEVKDCAGLVNGTAVADNCGVCDSDATNNDTTCDQDCNEVWNGLAELDDCGVCDSDMTNDNTTCEQDCAGVWSGVAIADCAGECDGEAALDCFGDCEGLKQLDICGICDGGRLDEGECEELCDGGEYDCSGCCSNGTNASDDTSCTYLGENDLDCFGECGGSAEEDCKGTCGGSIEEDCAGECGGSTEEDCFGECGGGASINDSGVCEECTGVVDCAGTCGGTAGVDACGICDGDGTICGDVAAMVNLANETMFSIMMELVEDDIDDINDVYDGLDMSYAKGLYMSILSYDSDNSDANFALAFIELSEIAQDNSFQGLVDEWTTCLETLDLDLDRSGPGANINSNDIESQTNNFLMTNGSSSGFPFSPNMFYSLNILDIFNYIPVITSPNDIMHRTADCPDIDSIQDQLENAFLTRLTSAIGRLDTVVGKDFVFEITGEMLDDADQDPIHIDDTEIYLMKALFHSFRAIIYAVITYDVNVPYYDFAEPPSEEYTYDFLNQSSDFLTIRSGQSQSWSNAHADLNNIRTSIQNSWDFLQSDYAIGGDNIEYDVIQFAEVVELEAEIHGEFNEIQTIDGLLTEVDTILNGDYPISVYLYEDCEWINDGWNEWEECEPGDPTDIDISIKNFLTNPPQNLKEIIPSYTIQTVSCEDSDYDHDENNNHIYFTIQDALLEGSDSYYEDYNNEYYDFSGQCYFNDETDNLNVNVWGSESTLNDLVEDEMRTICEDIIDTYEGDLEYFHMSFNFGNYPNSGGLTISDNAYYNIETSESFVWGCPEITFTSYSCGAWKEEFDVTIGGLFPNMTTTKFFDDIIQLDEDDCEEILGGGTP